jgi:hypothetical protein
MWLSSMFIPLHSNYITLTLLPQVDHCHTFFPPLALQPNLSLGHLHETFRFTSVTRPRTVGRTTWTGDQPIARPLPTHRTTQTQYKCTQDIYALSGFRTYDLSVRANNDSSCLRRDAKRIFPYCFITEGGTYRRRCALRIYIKQIYIS